MGLGPSTETRLPKQEHQNFTSPKFIWQCICSALIMIILFVLGAFVSTLGSCSQIMYHNLTNFWAPSHLCNASMLWHNTRDSPSLIALHNLWTPKQSVVD